MRWRGAASFPVNIRTVRAACCPLFGIIRAGQLLTDLLQIPNMTLNCVETEKFTDLSDWKCAEMKGTGSRSGGNAWCREGFVSRMKNRD